MKKLIHIVSILFVTASLFSEASLLEISSQSISTTQYTESEYNLKFGSTFEFSSGFDIISDTEDVSIYVNENKYNIDSLYLKNLTSGSYLISIKKSGYKTIKRWITLDDDTRIVIKVTLERNIGYFSVVTEQENLEYYINNISIQNNQAIPTGSYNLTVKGFGYKEETRNLIIYTGVSTKLNINLTEAPFKIKKISGDKAIYNPAAYSGFALNKIKVEVNGPGIGQLIIKDEYENTIITEQIKFLTWNTYYTLNQDLIDGKYTVTIEVNEMSESCFIDVDRTLFVHNIPIFRGLPGLAASSTAESNSIKVSSTSFGLNTILDNSQIEIPFSFQMNLNKYFSLRGGMDLSINFEDDSSEIEMFTGIKLINNLYNIFYALNINYQFNIIDNDLKEDYFIHKIILNTPLSLKLNDTYLSISPEYQFDITDASYILGLGTGVHFDNQLFRFGLSGRVDKNENSDLDYLFAGEIYYLLPGTQSFAGLTLSSNEDLLLSLLVNFTVLY